MGGTRSGSCLPVERKLSSFQSRNDPGAAAVTTRAPHLHPQWGQGRRRGCQAGPSGLQGEVVSRRWPRQTPFLLHRGLCPRAAGKQLRRHPGRGCGRATMGSQHPWPQRTHLPLETLSPHVHPDRAHDSGTLALLLPEQALEHGFLLSMWTAPGLRPLKARPGSGAEKREVKPCQDSQKWGVPAAVQELRSLSGRGATDARASPTASAACSGLSAHSRSESCALDADTLVLVHRGSSPQAHCCSVGVNSLQHFCVFTVLYLEISK